MSVRKRQWITGQGENREAWVVEYTDAIGKRRRKTFKRKKEADAYDAKVRVDVRAGVHVADSASVTVAEAADLWLDACRNRGLERTTIALYADYCRCHIVPFLGKTRLSSLTRAAVRDFEDRLRRGDGPAVGRVSGPRSSFTVKKVLVALSSLISDAQERGLVAINAVRDMRARRVRGLETRAEKRQRGKLKVGVDIPSPEEIRSLIGNLRGRWRPILLTAIFTGLRSSELRGLRWGDVDFKKSEVHVRQRVDRFGEMGAPKSAAGERALPVPPSLVSALKEWRLACPLGELDLVFPTSTGRPLGHGDVVDRGLLPTLVAAGVVDREGRAKYGGLHALRHFYASWCINRKTDGGLELPPKVVQTRLGHSTIAMTLDVYGHLFPSGDDGAELAAAETLLLSGG